METALAAGTIIAAIGISWGVTKATGVFLKSRVDKLDQQLNGNGQEGVIIKCARMETTLLAIKEDIKEIKEAVKKP